MYVYSSYIYVKIWSCIINPVWCRWLAYLRLIQETHVWFPLREILVLLPHFLIGAFRTFQAQASTHSLPKSRGKKSDPYAYINLLTDPFLYPLHYYHLRHTMNIAPFQMLRLYWPPCDWDHSVSWELSGSVYQIIGFPNSFYFHNITGKWLI